MRSLLAVVWGQYDNMPGSSEVALKNRKKYCNYGGSCLCSQSPLKDQYGNIITHGPCLYHFHCIEHFLMYILSPYGAFLNTNEGNLFGKKKLLREIFNIATLLYNIHTLA